MIYGISKHVRIVPDEPENMHPSVLCGRVQRQKTLCFRTLVHCPCDYRQLAVCFDIGGIDLSESRLLIAGAADEPSGSVAKRFGDARGLLEDIGRREGVTADAVEGSQCERIETGDQNPVTQPEFVYQPYDLP